jgi:hypothetical protein
VNGADSTVGRGAARSEHHVSLIEVLGDESRLRAKVTLGPCNGKGLELGFNSTAINRGRCAGLKTDYVQWKSVRGDHSEIGDYLALTDVGRQSVIGQIQGVQGVHAVVIRWRRVRGGGFTA